MRQFFPSFLKKQQGNGRGRKAVPCRWLALAGSAPGHRWVTSCPLQGFLVLGFGLGVGSVAATSAGMAQVKATEQGLVAGLLNTAAQLGTVLGLALLDMIAAASAAVLKSSGYTETTALIAGFRWAFAVSAGVAIVGVLVAIFVVDHG